MLYALYMFVGGYLCGLGECVSVWVCLVKCEDRSWHSRVRQSLSILHVETKSLTGAGAHWFSWDSCPESSRKPLVSNSPSTMVQGTTVPSLLCGYRTSRLSCSSCSHGRHFTHWAIFQSKEIIFNSRMTNYCFNTNETLALLYNNVLHSHLPSVITRQSSCYKARVNR